MISNYLQQTPLADDILFSDAFFLGALRVNWENREDILHHFDTKTEMSMIRKYHNKKLQTNPKSYRTFTVTRHPKHNKSFYNIVVIDYIDFSIFQIGLNFGIF